MSLPDPDRQERDEGMYEVPGWRLRELRDEQERLRQAIRDFRGSARYDAAARAKLFDVLDKPGPILDSGRGK